MSTQSFPAAATLSTVAAIFAGDHPAGWYLAPLFISSPDAIYYLDGYHWENFVARAELATTYKEVEAIAAEYPDLDDDCYSALNAYLEAQEV